MRLATAPTGDPTDMVVDLPDAHWARQGRVVLDVEVVDGVITAADLAPGFMHRGAEKLLEARDYRQGLALANRHDWLAPVGGEILVARAAEDLLGMTVPDRARVLRVLVLELSRVSALLAFLGPAAEVLGSPAPEPAAARERVLDCLEGLTGARMHVTYTVVGGVRADADAAWRASVRDALDSVPDSNDWSAVPAGLGRIDRATAASHGASGIVGRASGIPLDVRTDDPDYDGLAHLLPAAPADPAGDAPTRLGLMIAELQSAVALARALEQRLNEAPGPIAVQLPKVLRVPVGSSTQWLETPLGAAGVLLESRGERAPHRVSLRTPSFAHGPLVAAALVGHSPEDILVILSSFPLVVGDLDK